jgi:hypothetical protein
MTSLMSAYPSRKLCVLSSFNLLLERLTTGSRSVVKNICDGFLSTRSSRMRKRRQSRWCSTLAGKLICHTGQDDCVSNVKAEHVNDICSQSRALVESSIGLGGREAAVQLARTGVALRSMRRRDCLRAGADRRDIVEG